jgi:AcrR family transcriptional regulator
MATSKRIEQGEATRGQLVAAARALFGKRGFADVATGEIVERAGVTRGALYHHFPRKEDLFRAAWEAVEVDILERVALASIEASDPFDGLRRGSEAFLDVCLDADVQQIVLIDGPVVLGWDTWQELDAQYGLGVVIAGLEAAVTAKQIDPQPLEPLAQMLLAALSQAGLMVARADDQAAARAEYGAVLLRILDGMRAADRG